MAVDGKHRHLVACLWGETLQNCGGAASWYYCFPRLRSEQRLVRDPVATNVTRGRGPRHGKTGVGDVAGHQVSGWAELWGMDSKAEVDQT